MSDRKYCNQPDRDFVEMKCGYPLPCPWHTVTIDLTRNPAILEIPVTANEVKKPSVRMRLSEIAEILIQGEEDKP